MESVLFAALVAVAVLGGAAAVLLTRRAAAPGAQITAAAHPEGLARIHAEVHTGWEQTLLGLTREVGLPRRSSDVAYGGFYLDPQAEDRLLIRSRSEIGRGYIGSFRLQPRRALTLVDYSIVRLPGDDTLHDRVLALELQIIDALRRIDRNVNVQLTGEALRDFDRPRRGADGPRSASEQGA